MTISTMHRTAVRYIEEENVNPRCVTISLDGPAPPSIRLEVRRAKHFAIALLTKSEARELANELLKAAGAMANF